VEQNDAKKKLNTIKAEQTHVSDLLIKCKHLKEEKIALTKKAGRVPG
jgi:hypothetical protein